MKDMKTGKGKEYKMKKDKVLLYDGGFIDYEQWNAPIVIDIQEISIQNPVPVTILGGYAVGTANVQRDGTVAHPISLLFADVDITKLDEFDQDMVANLKFACDIVVQDGGYVQPNTSFDVNARTLTAGKNGAWLITKAKLKAVTATPNDNPDWKIDHDKGENRMDENQETLEAHFTNDELKNFEEGKTNLTIPLVYEDEDKIQHNAGEVTLTHIVYGQAIAHCVLIETFCWPSALHGIPSDETNILLNLKDDRNGSPIGFKVMLMDDVDRGLGFAPVSIQTFIPINVTISRKYPSIALEKTTETTLTGTQKAIAEKCDAIKNLLLEKNRKYGNSALNPVRVFSKADKVEQIKVRMDDKLSRIRNEQGDEDEDVYMDLAGYLVLMLIAKEEQKEQEKGAK